MLFPEEPFCSVAKKTTESCVAVTEKFSGGVGGGEGESSLCGYQLLAAEGFLGQENESAAWLFLSFSGDSSGSLPLACYSLGTNRRNRLRKRRNEEEDNSISFDPLRTSR